MSTLLETLIHELERPKELPGQVSDHIWGTYEIDRDAVGDFLDARLPQLDDDEHDLILSPLFTPKLADQALFATLLGKQSIPKTDWPALVEQLDAKPIRTTLITSDKKPHIVALRPVVIERYLHRLRLDGAIHDSIFSLLDDHAFQAERPTLLAVARRAIWETEGRRNILATYLAAAGKRNAYEPGDGIRLLRLVEDYKPADVAHLMERIPIWLEALRVEIEKGDAPKPFFSNSVMTDHGGERDQRQRETARIDARKDEAAFLNRLHSLLID